MPKTLYDKLWDEHHIVTLDSSESLIYIDRQYLHEVTSPQAFEGLTKKDLRPWRLCPPKLTYSIHPYNNYQANVLFGKFLIAKALF